MLRTTFRTAGIVVAAISLLTSIALGQDNRYEISLSGGAVISNQPEGNGTTLSPTTSGMVLVTGRYRFSEKSSIELNYGHTSNSQIYSSPPLTYRIKNTIGEYSGAYVFSFHQSEKIEPFVFVGAAALVFYPGYSFNTVNDVQTFLPASSQTKPALLYGGGLDCRIFSASPWFAKLVSRNTWPCVCSTAGFSTRLLTSTCKTCSLEPEDTWRNLPLELW